MGARVTAVVGTEVRVRYVDGGSHYLGQSELTAHFGLGAATKVDTLTVTWPVGPPTVLHDVAVDQNLTVVAP